MYKNLMYICFSKRKRQMKNSQLYKGSLNTIIMKLLEENGKMYGYEITQKVKAITQGELNITEGLCILLCINWKPKVCWMSRLKKWITACENIINSRKAE